MIKMLGLIQSMDPDALKSYLSQVGATVTSFGGEVVARGQTGEPFWNELNCEPFDSFVEVCFESMDQARAWAQSPAYQTLLIIRKKAMRVTFFELQKS